MLAVKAALSSGLLVLAIAGTVAAEGPKGSQLLSVTFAVDGKEASCPDLKVALHFHDREIEPNRSGQGFIVPTVFQNTKNDTDKVDVTLTCGAYSLNFSDLPSSWVSPGRWEFGIAYPPSWIERFGWTTAVEHGTWISYLESECNGCDPGVFTTVSHPNPPASLIESLKREQSSSSGQRSRDIAYALAVFNAEYQQNRDFLLEELHTCLARPKESPEDDVCDSDLLSFVTNLYWRGDTALLPTLIQIAESRRDVIGEIGTFYADLLDRRGVIVLNAMGVLPDDKQQLVCKLADEDLIRNSPSRNRIIAFLHGAQSRATIQCLTVLDNN